jgi:hypothetical protein
MNSKVKYNFERLKIFLQENNVPLLDEYTEQNVNCNKKIKGKCIEEGCVNII